VSGLRIGSGFDSHRLVEGRPLMLGGIEIPSARGLLGHSDGDCVCHAICDALLGAAAAGDMGTHFPSSEERWRDVSGRRFLSEVRGIVEARGFRIENIDVTAIAQEPRLAPHVAAMRGALAACLGLDEERVSVKAKSADHMGAVGREEGIAALATVLLRAPDHSRDQDQGEQG
jgi:2-C-methyl-D-erythritol 2,4-cyclodiphosphate synthase